MIDLRYVLFGAALTPHLRREPPLAQALLAFTLTDETFAVNIDDARAGTADAPTALFHWWRRDLLVATVGGILAFLAFQALLR